MKLEIGAFEAIDWSKIPATTHPGESGVATWRTVQKGDVRIRMVDYSPDYVADHWCDKGHVVLVIEGELTTRLKDGRDIQLRKGMSYTVRDGGEAHRSASRQGARLFIVD